MLLWGLYFTKVDEKNPYKGTTTNLNSFYPFFSLFISNIYISRIHEWMKKLFFKEENCNFKYLNNLDFIHYYLKKEFIILWNSNPLIF